ncbi:MAG: nucleotidyltransferase family protein [Syntrophomonas sp.]
MDSLFNQLKRDSKRINKIATKFGVKSIRIFGSVARGENLQTSDIDLLVDFNEDASLFDLINLKLELEEIYKKKIDIVTINSLHPSMASQVMDEAVLL